MVINQNIPKEKRTKTNKNRKQNTFDILKVNINCKQAKQWESKMSLNIWKQATNQTKPNQMSRSKCFWSQQKWTLGRICMTTALEHTVASLQIFSNMESVSWSFILTEQKSYKSRQFRNTLMEPSERWVIARWGNFRPRCNLMIFLAFRLVETNDLLC